MFTKDDLFFAYTRTQAIADGVLIDVTEMAREAGFSVPVAMTSAAWGEFVTVPDGVGGQDEKGRLWDVLTMLRFYVGVADTAGPEILFSLYVLNRPGDEPEMGELKAVCGPDDEGSPCVTVMLPDEDQPTSETKRAGPSCSSAPPRITEDFPMITIKTFERNPCLSELKVSYKRRRAADKKQLSMPFFVADPVSAEEYLRRVWDQDTFELREEFVLVCLNAAHEVLGWIRLTTGGVGSTVVDPKLLFAVALKTVSSAIVVAHNHPSGSVEPSAEDIETTRRIAAGARTVGVRLLDHIILGREKSFSMARAGLLGE